MATTRVVQVREELGGARHGEDLVRLQYDTDTVTLQRTEPVGDNQQTWYSTRICI